MLKEWFMGKQASSAPSQLPEKSNKFSDFMSGLSGNKSGTLRGLFGIDKDKFNVPSSGFLRGLFNRGE
jgi:hypothetical protein